ncbi:MAG: DUF1405 domain-containing protein [Halodesulfurarchaeum sp.]
MSLIPHRHARYYLENTPSLLWLLLVNFLTVLVGVDFYVTGMAEVHPLLWPFYADSPGATLLMVLSLVTLVSNLGSRLHEATQNRVLAYLHTLAFVWLVKYGLWVAVALNLGFDHYFPAVWAYWGIIVAHLGFVAEAFLIPHYGKTTRGALAFALGLGLLGDVLDYGFGLHPPLRYDPGLALALLTGALTVFAVGLASWQFDRLEGSGASGSGRTSSRPHHDLGR